MRKSWKQKSVAMFAAITVASQLLSGSAVTSVKANATNQGQQTVDSFETDAVLDFTRTASVSIGTANEDGGVAEIVAYNKDNQKTYVVNGQEDFGTISDRADRLMGRAGQLLEYAKQVQDAYQAQVDARQNKNMEFLTVISTIFFPLTLITGWFGMNFKNMPELENGYPGVILLSLVVVVGCILFFKKKKML